jgi:hypothetical protein
MTKYRTIAILHLTLYAHNQLTLIGKLTHNTDSYFTKVHLQKQ